MKRSLTIDLCRLGWLKDLTIYTRRNTERRWREVADKNTHWLPGVPTRSSKRAFLCRIVFNVTRSAAHLLKQAEPIPADRTVLGDVERTRCRSKFVQNDIFCLANQFAGGIDQLNAIVGRRRRCQPLIVLAAHVYFVLNGVTGPIDALRRGAPDPHMLLLSLIVRPDLLTRGPIGISLELIEERQDGEVIALDCLHRQGAIAL